MRTLALALALSSCAGFSKISKDTLNCSAPDLVRQLPTVITDVLGALTGSNTTTDLNRILGSEGAEVTYCAVEAALTDLENGGATGPVAHAMGPASAASKPTQNIGAIARGEAWIAVHSK